MKYIIIIFYVKFDGESIGGNFKLIETIFSQSYWRNFIVCFSKNFVSGT